MNLSIENEFANNIILSCRTFDTNTNSLKISVQILRGTGTLLRQRIQDIVTPEDVCNKWDKVTDMTNATVTPNIQVNGTR